MTHSNNLFTHRLAPPTDKHSISGADLLLHTIKTLEHKPPSTALSHPCADKCANIRPDMLLCIMATSTPGVYPVNPPSSPPQLLNLTDGRDTVTVLTYAASVYIEAPNAKTVTITANFAADITIVAPMVRHDR